MRMELIILLGGLIIGLVSACSLGASGSTENHNESFVLGDAPATSDDSGGAPRVSLTYLGVVYNATSLSTDEAANLNESELEAVGETSESNLLFPGSGEPLNIYKLIDGEDGYVYTLESGRSFQNEDGKIITIEAEVVRWVAADSNG